MAESTVPEGDIWFERKHGGSRDWSDTGSGQIPFKNSSSRRRESDDQLELEWAALEKLPTYHRLRTAILDPNGDAQEARGTIDVRHLAKGQRTSIVEKALATTEQDNERFLSKVKERLLRLGHGHSFPFDSRINYLLCPIVAAFVL